MLNQHAVMDCIAHVLVGKVIDMSWTCFKVGQMSEILKLTWLSTTPIGDSLYVGHTRR